MKIESIEILLVVIIVAIQAYVFVRTFNQIGLFKNIIPSINSLRVTRVLVPSSDLEKFSPKEILANISLNKNSNLDSHQYVPSGDFGDSDSPKLFFEQNQNDNQIDKSEVNIIESYATKNLVFEKILFSTNNYLIRNRGASSDFNLIKDIVERNIDAVEEDINSSIGIPLYLGLMGK